MKSYLLLFFSIILFNSCTNNDDDIVLQTEDDIIEYIADNNLNATKTNSGLYYVINEEGTGTIPTEDENPIVSVSYTLSFLDGTTVGESDAAIMDLTSLIIGLKEGLLLMKEGGEGTFIIPYELAYGKSGNYTGSIPGGTVLVFDVKIKAVYPDYIAENEAAILQYIADNNLDATKTDSGLYYVKNNETTGISPTSTSNVTASYKGYYLDKTVFDEGSLTGYLNGSLIDGWKEGLQLFKEGESGILLVPYYLGYGEYTYNNTIPGHSVLIFDINLISVND